MLQSLALVTGGLVWMGSATGAIAEIPSRPAIEMAPVQIAQESIEITESLLQGVVEELSPTLPTQVNDQVRWDSVSAGPGKRLTLSYTAIGVSSSQLQGTERETFQSTFQKEVVTDSCKQSEVLLLLQNGVSLGIHLNGSDGREISDFQFGIADCPAGQ